MSFWDDYRLRCRHGILEDLDYHDCPECRKLTDIMEDLYSRTLEGLERIGWPCRLEELPEEYRKLGQLLIAERQKVTQLSIELKHIKKYNEQPSCQGGCYSVRGEDIGELMDILKPHAHSDDSPADTIRRILIEGY